MVPGGYGLRRSGLKGEYGPGGDGPGDGKGTIPSNHKSRQCASYWNAFLYNMALHILIETVNMSSRGPVYLSKFYCYCKSNQICPIELIKEVDLIEPTVLKTGS